MDVQPEQSKASRLDSPNEIVGLLSGNCVPPGKGPRPPRVMSRNVFPDIETHRPWEVTSLKKERRYLLPRPSNKKTRAALRRHSGSSESIRPYPRSGIKGLLHETLQHDHVFNVVVGPRFKGNGA